ncbi:MAG: matrixin family metalloprotease [Chthonomonas sp.]|nr:matrixin family metalloprotease [Chthonomonas sp.]
MMKRSYSALLPLSACAVCLALLTLGCGGGGSGTGSSGGSTSGGSCSPTSYLPNYVSDISGGDSLFRWTTFPVRFFQIDAGTWSAKESAAWTTAVNAWEARSGNQITFLASVASAGANITIEYKPVSFISGDAVGVTTIGYVGATLVSAKIEVATLDSGGNARNQTDLTKIVMHELGHAIGIGGHSSLSTDLMYPFVVASTPTTPTVRDWNTVQTAYCGSFSRLSGRSSVLGPVETRVIACPAH